MLLSNKIKFKKNISKKLQDIQAIKKKYCTFASNCVNDKLQRIWK
jgi:hypothetical protein